MYLQCEVAAIPNEVQREVVEVCSSLPLHMN